MTLSPAPTVGSRKNAQWGWSWDKSMERPLVRWYGDRPPSIVSVLPYWDSWQLWTWCRLIPFCPGCACMGCEMVEHYWPAVGGSDVGLKPVEAEAVVASVEVVVMNTTCLHCMLLRSGIHWPDPLILVQVMLMRYEGTSPSSHWMVTVAPSVVLDRSLTVALEGITGVPQSAMKH
jgi:hypothetical protein